MLTSLRVALHYINDAASGMAGPLEGEVLELGERLGSGGTSDVYACKSRVGGGSSGGGSSGGGCASASCGDYCVLKVARVATASIAAGFVDEGVLRRVNTPLKPPSTEHRGSRSVNLIVHAFPGP